MNHKLSKAQELMVKGYAAFWASAADRARRAERDRGQTAVEYLGIIAFVVAFILVMMQTDIGSDIVGKIQGKIGELG